MFAADAVARLSGTVGVAAVTAGPGLTNTVTAVKNAQMAESPLLLIGGAAASLLKVWNGKSSKIWNTSCLPKLHTQTVQFFPVCYPYKHFVTSSPNWDPVCTDWSLTEMQLCCRALILALFLSTTANKIDSEHTRDYKF